jgi:peptidoglycan/xylan/chitin deacetylase (PgdA/CDA1 family)
MNIITYHQLIPGPEDEYDLRRPRVTVDDFSRQLDVLIEHFDIVGMQPAMDALMRGEETHHKLVITFDDGYRSVLQLAFPEMSRRGLMGMLYVVTGYVPSLPGSYDDYDDIELSFRLTKKTVLETRFLDGVSSALDLSSDRLRAKAMKLCRKCLKRLPLVERRRKRKQLVGSLNVSEEEMKDYASTSRLFEMLSWDEVAHMCSKGWDVGSHTVSHAAVGLLPLSLARRELRDSLDALERQIPKCQEFVSLAYPYGGLRDIGTVAPTIARNLGYACAVTTIAGENSVETDRFRLRRFEFESLSSHFGLSLAQERK